MQKKMDMIRQKLFLDDHHKMERFCVTFIIFVLILGLLFGICVKRDQDNQKLNLSTVALYTRSAKFSLTGETISFINLYRNVDFTKAFILLKINGGMDNLSINPRDYQILATGNDSKITCNPQCGIYMFGTTGYMGLYFTDAAGFNAALYDMVLRNYVMIGNHSNPNAAAEYGGESYATYNQAHFFVNLRGEDGIIANFLNGDQPIVSDIYKEIIVTESFNNAVNNARSTLTSMNSSMALLNEYIARLSNYNITVPDLPVMIAGDQIVTDEVLTTSNAKEFNPAAMSSDSLLSSDLSQSANESSFGTLSSIGWSDPLYLVTDYVYPGGVQFNYQTSLVTDKFLSNFYPDGKLYKDFVSEKAYEKQTYNSKSVYTAPEKWYYKDGTEFIYDATYGSVENHTIQSLIDSYNSEISKICTLKRTYQCDQLPVLFKIEFDADAMTSVIEFYSDEYSIILY